MSFPDAVLTIKDQEVVVTCEKIKEDSLHRYRFTATCGEASKSHTITIGPIDGEIEAPSLEQMQSDVDAARMEVAKHAHARHVISQYESQIK